MEAVRLRTVSKGGQVGGQVFGVRGLDGEATSQG